MFVSLNIWGAYVFWAMICFVGFIVLGLWAPETKGIPMERMEELFGGKWWMGWNANVDMTVSSNPDFQHKGSVEKDVVTIEEGRM